MYTAFRTALASIKTKKLQNILIGLMLLITTTLLYSGVSILCTDSAFDKMFNRAKCFHTIIQMSEERFDESFLDFWNNNDNTEVALTYTFIEMPGPVQVNGVTQDIGYRLFEYPISSQYNRLYTIDGELLETIGENEVWVPTGTAYNYDIHEGDIISAKVNGEKIDFKVAKIVVDPIYSSGMFNPSRLWVAEGTIKKYFPAQAKNHELSIRFKNYSEDTEILTIKNFKSTLKGDYFAKEYRFPFTKMLYTITLDLLSAGLFIMALLILVMVMFIIRSTIQHLILNRFKSIGVMKALGYTRFQVYLSFMLQFLILFTLVAPFGIVIGHQVRTIILKAMTQTLGIPVENVIVLPVIITILSLYVVITLFTLWSTRPAGYIKPAQAIKYAMPEQKQAKTRFNISKYTKLPISLLIVIKQILGNKKHSLFQVTLFTLSIYFAVLVVSLGTSFKDKDMIMQYVAIGSGDMVITPDAESRNQVSLDKLKSVDGISGAMKLDYTESCNVYSIKQDDYIALTGIMIQGDIAEIGFKTIEGRLPVNEDELLITSYISKQTAKTVGDYIEINWNTHTSKYLVVGIYDTVFNNAEEIVAYSRTEIDFSERYLEPTFKVTLTKPYDEVEAKLRSIFGDKVGIEPNDYATKQMRSILDKISSVLFVVCIFFMLLCGFAIFNWTIMEIKSSSRIYGIYKATGMSNSMLMRMLLIKAGILSMLGCLLGSVLSKLFVDNFILFFLNKSFDFSTFSINVSWVYALLASVIYIIVCAISTLVPAKRIRDIKPRVLIVE